MNKLAKGHGNFTGAEVAICREDQNPGSCLTKLYKQKNGYGLNKIKLNEFLESGMFAPGSRRKIENRPIIKVLDKVVRLANRNHFPTRQEGYEINQASKFFGKKTKQKEKRPKIK